ncbi:MAG: Rho-type gtpase-activating protein [Chaenotheca gracillima]|nr:MAG: Rho-type gtpase-activating protein [Chaenotheca gracillima]
MSHQSSTSGRNLSVTEELEKLEQSITLTLQGKLTTIEIDHNFSRAHRIVTTSILPVVEQYAEHSKAVWEGSKFWKQFFEASANVSLSGYEELAASERGDEEGEDTGYTASHDTTSTTASSHNEGDDLEIGDDTITGTADPSQRRSSRHDDTISSLLSSPSIAGSTPHTRAPSHPRRGSRQPSYETNRREMRSPSRGDEGLPSPPDLGTPRGDSRFPNVSTSTPESSPFQPIPTTARKRSQDDPLLHRVLDKTYRLQATPHQQTSTKNQSRRAAQNNDSSPMSSPAAPAPQLHSEIFSSPVRNQRQRNIPSSAGPRTPGVSVFDSPARGEGVRSERTGNVTGRTATGHRGGVWDSDSEDDTDMGFPAGMSPPKTMQFAVPTSRLLRTPAREASKAIVSNLLQSAGLNTASTVPDDEIDYFDYDAPSDDESTDLNPGAGVRRNPSGREGSISPSLVIGRGVGGGQGNVDDSTF